jgi:beta-barrel assembly-enhancing protease
MQLREFSGGVFSEQIEGGRAGADVELSSTGISAMTTDGRHFNISYSECQVQIGGFSGRMVFCRNRDRSLTIFCEHKEFAHALSEASLGLLESQLEQQLKQRRRERGASRGLGVAILMAIVVLVVGGYFVVRIAAQAAVQALPIRVDQEIGEHAFAGMDLGGPEVRDAEVVHAMQAIVDRMAPEAALDGLEFEVHVVESAEVNAFALPGGTVVVYTGLIEQANHPGEIAGVLGHEMAHATLRHGLERISQSLGMAAAVNFLLGDASGIMMAGAELFQLASINSYSREQEAAADAEGVRMMYEAGIDPMAITDFFATLHKEHGDLPGVVSWISTHPQHEARIEAVKEQVAALPRKEYRPLEIDLEDIKQRLQER